MSFPDEMKNKASDLAGKIVLPEGDDDRIVKAARQLIEQDVVKSVYLLNCDSQFQEDNISTIQPGNDRDIDEMAHTLANQSDMPLSDAEETVQQPLFYASSMVNRGKVDGMVAGADNPTANVLRAALSMIGTKPESSVVSSSFVMEVDDSSFGVQGRMLFTDPAVVPDPEPEQLPEMAGDAVGMFRDLIGEDQPRVAFLSFSTRGSAEHPKVDKMRQAAETFQEQFPDVQSDGELQADAAIVPGVANRKAPDSPIGGQANVLIFPDLDSANIGYKLVQRLAGAGAYGPFLQGLDGAVNDLSRGCSVDDVVTVSAVTMVQGA